MALLAVMGLWFTAVSAIDQTDARATPTVKVQQGNPITITVQAADPQYIYNPAGLNANVGQPITITNDDPNGLHSVTARDRSFNVDVPPKSNVTLTVSNAGSFPYYCTYHLDQHNPATNVS